MYGRLWRVSHNDFPTRQLDNINPEQVLRRLKHPTPMDGGWGWGCVQ